MGIFEIIFFSVFVVVVFSRYYLGLGEVFFFNLLLIFLRVFVEVVDLEGYVGFMWCWVFVIFFGDLIKGGLI